MFKTIYDTFIKAIIEKDVETVFYILQNDSIESVFKMLQDNNDSIKENAQTEIILEDRESNIIVNVHNWSCFDSDFINVGICVTIPKITQHESLNNLEKFFINYPYISFEDLDELGNLQITKRGLVKMKH